MSRQHAAPGAAQTTPPPAFRIGAALAIGLGLLSGGGVVPGWGTAIGFLVGTGVGVLTYIVLDRALPRVEPTAP